MSATSGMREDAPDVLKRILARKLEEIRERRHVLDDAELQRRVEAAEAPRGFVDAIRQAIVSGGPAVIAEIKKASPSKGVLREPFDPVAIAASYSRGGATCLSVLTDVDFFQGSDAALIEARAACALPVLRKDFLIDPWQVDESRSIGADCILLIVAALDDETLESLNERARVLGMDVLVEVHDRNELDRALTLSPTLLGINNRDLRSFDVSLATTRSLIDAVPSDTLIVTESGIQTREDVASMRRAGIHGFLIGEAFMRQSDPGTALEQLTGASI